MPTMEEWTWVGTVAVAVTAIAAMFFTWWTGKNQRDHEKDMAVTQRRQQRLQDAYALAFAANVSYLGQHGTAYGRACSAAAATRRR